MRVSSHIPARRGAAIASVVALSAALAACGGGAAGEPSAVQTQLVAVADALDRCTAKTGDARKCTSVDALGELPAGVKLGEGDGSIAINASRPTRYQLTAKADGGSEFALLAQPVGARKRVCTPAGKDGCPEAGAW